MGTPTWCMIQALAQQGMALGDCGESASESASLYDWTEPLPCTCAPTMPT
eukprot:m.371295 g.371295  ORF g.371295 m.371295 type:complete len:50 (+) comp28128_c2_seq2:267-416(+)